MWVEFADLGRGVVTVDGDRVTVDHKCSYFDAVRLLDGVVPQTTLDDLFLPPLRTAAPELGQAS